MDLKLGHHAKDGIEVIDVQGEIDIYTVKYAMSATASPARVTAAAAATNDQPAGNSASSEV